MKNLIIALFICTATKLSAQSNGFFINRGANIYYEMMGSGAPIIFLHGGPGLNHTYMMPYFHSLAETHTLVFFDQRGCGKSAGQLEKSDITLQNTIDDIDAIRKMLKVEKVTLVAHSFGCLLAVKYAEQYTDHVASLVLLNSVALSHEYDKETQILEVENTAERYKLRRDSILKSQSFKAGDAASYEILYKESFRPVFYNETLSDKFSIHMESNIAKDRLKLFNLSPELASYNLYTNLRVIRCPVMIINGRYDLIPIVAQTRIRDSMATVQWHVMQRSGHFPFIEQQGELLNYITSFLSTNHL